MESFRQIDTWINDVKNARGSSSAAMILVGNKSDMQAERKVSTEEGMRKAEDHGMLFIETSAKTPTNIRELFLKIAHSLPIAEDEFDAKQGCTGKLSPPRASGGMRYCLCWDPIHGAKRGYRWLSSWFY